MNLNLTPTGIFTGEELMSSDDIVGMIVSKCETDDNGNVKTTPYHREGEPMKPNHGMIMQTGNFGTIQKMEELDDAYMIVQFNPGAAIDENGIYKFADNTTLRRNAKYIVWSKEE